MLKCVLNVTDHEYDKILQKNHDALVWQTTDHEVMEGLEDLLDKDVVEQVRKFEECRMEKHHEISGIPRVQAV